MSFHVIEWFVSMLETNKFIDIHSKTVAGRQLRNTDNTLSAIIILHLQQKEGAMLQSSCRCITTNDRLVTRNTVSSFSFIQMTDHAPPDFSSAVTNMFYKSQHALVASHTEMSSNYWSDLGPVTLMFSRYPIAK